MPIVAGTGGLHQSLKRSASALLALIARDNIGMPPDMVREAALIGVSVMLAVMAGMYSYKRKH